MSARSKGLIVVFVLTTCLYALLYFLDINFVGPVVFRPSTAGVVTQHGVPTLSFAGGIIWLASTLVYAVASVLLAARNKKRAARWFLGLGVFIFSAVYIAIIHPTFILTVMTPADRARFIEWASRSAAPVYAYYFGGNIFRRVVLLLAVVHALIVGLVVTAGGGASTAHSDAALRSAA